MSAAAGARLRQILSAAPAETDPQDIAWAMEQARLHGALDAVAAACRAQAQAARDELLQLPRGDHRELLAELTDFITHTRTR